MNQLQQQHQPTCDSPGENSKAGAFPPLFYSSHCQDYSVQPATKASGKSCQTQRLETVGILFQYWLHEKKTQTHTKNVEEDDKNQNTVQKVSFVV